MGYVCNGKSILLLCMIDYHYFLCFLEIDECLIDPCDSNATCTNTNGSYICECNTGFTGTGFNCSSMNYLLDTFCF